jgi:hypothetical protein
LQARFGAGWGYDRVVEGEQPIMAYDFIASPEPDVPQARDPLFHHLIATYAGETKKTTSMWRAIPDDLLEFKPHEKVNTIRAILSGLMTCHRDRRLMTGREGNTECQERYNRGRGSDDPSMAGNAPTAGLMSVRKALL